MAIDISQDIGSGVGDTGPVIKQAQRLWKLEHEIEATKTRLKELEDERNTLALDTLPNLMESVGVSNLTLNNGWKLDIKPNFRASIPSTSAIERADDDERPLLINRLEEGLRWLRNNKGGDLIKSTLKLDLGRGQEKLAKQFMTLAKQLKVPINKSLAVHPGTLASFLREKLSKGATVPLDTFGVYDGKEAVLKAPKKGKENGKETSTGTATKAGKATFKR